MESIRGEKGLAHNIYPKNVEAEVYKGYHDTYIYDEDEKVMGPVHYSSN